MNDSKPAEKAAPKAENLNLSQQKLLSLNDAKKENADSANSGNNNHQHKQGGHQHKHQHNHNKNNNRNKNWKNNRNNRNRNRKRSPYHEQDLMIEEEEAAFEGGTPGANLQRFSKSQ